jgi:Spy/CpxP family protein refolding chaperone
MKPTKLILITTLALGSLLTLNPAAFAQDATNTPPPAGGPPPGPGMHGRGPNFDTIAQRLNLTEDQKPKVKSILEEQGQKMRDLRQQSQDMSQEDRMAKMKSIREETDTKMKAVLTADQFKQWQEMESRMRGPRNGPPGGPPPGQGSPNAPATAAPQK